MVASRKLRQVKSSNSETVSEKDKLQGEIVVTEDPLLFLPTNEVSNVNKYLNSEFEKLSIEKQKKVTSLYDPDSSCNDEEKVLRIFRVNCIQGDHKTLEMVESVFQQTRLTGQLCTQRFPE